MTPIVVFLKSPKRLARTISRVTPIDFWTWGTESLTLIATAPSGLAIRLPWDHGASSTRALPSIQQFLRNRPAIATVSLYCGRRWRLRAGRGFLMKDFGDA